MTQARLSFEDQEINLNIIEGTEGEKGLDISKLRGQTGLITLDGGFVNTGSCESNVTFIDGEKGILRYRGYSIESLCEGSDFTEVAYLLMKGHLPTQDEYDNFRQEVRENQDLHTNIIKLMEAFPANAHPMCVLGSAVNSLSAYYNDHLNPLDEVDREIAMTRAFAKIPMLAAWSYRIANGLPVVYPDPKLGYAANFLKMMFSKPGENFEVDEDIAKALDLLLILHADHEQNCSTATVRVVGSSHANLYAALTGGIMSLWGPLHGGANQKVLEMLKRIHDDGGNAQKYIEMAKDKENPFRLMGFGHRVYKNFDPRARIIQKYCAIVLSKLGMKDPLLNIAQKLEEAALNDSYFADRKLYPNVDFYSGILYKAMGIPVRMFTVMFAIGRAPGWLTQWKEMIQDPSGRIARPRQIYQGENLREFKSNVTKRD